MQTTGSLWPSLLQSRAQAGAADPEASQVSEETENSSRDQHRLKCSRESSGCLDQAQSYAPQIGEEPERARFRGTPLRHTVPALHTPVKHRCDYRQPATG